MSTWLIVLIVVLVLLLVILPAIVLNMSGIITCKMLRKTDFGARKIKGMDVSFYDRGPLPKLADEGLKLMDSLDVKEVHIDSYDGYKLQAYVIKNPNIESNKYFLGMHGFKSGPRHEYAPYLKYYLDMGFNIIIPCERAHYRSEGDYITMGIRERYDALAWCKYIVNTYGEDIKILMQGVSMGAATVCSASSLELPCQVVGIISDCAYSSIKDELYFQMDKVSKYMPKKLFLSFIKMYIKGKIHVNLNDDQPIDAVKNAKVPLLFFHGEKDEMVDVKFSKELYENTSSRKKLVIVPEANHAESMAYLKDEYFKTIQEFFNL